MTKVVHIQNHNSPSGNAAFRLHKGLLENGIDSFMLSLTSEAPISKRVSKLRLRGSFKALLHGRLHRRKIRKVDTSYGMFSSPILGNNIVNHEMVQNADIIYLHWVLAGFLNYKNIEDLAKLGKPIIVFMHDMWTITGGCHYSFSCENYKTDCSSCQMFPNGGSQLPMKEFKKKLKLYNTHKNLHFLAPSTWLFDLAKTSMLTKGKDIVKIPNLVDAKPFKLVDQKSAREILGLNASDTIILFGAVSPRSPYKGWSFLTKALEHLATKKNITNITVAVFGSDYDEEIASAIPFKTQFLGRLRDEYSTATAYNAADVFVAPSLAETFGLVVLEALRCQTPVAAFDTGGINDIIEHKQNGYLAKYKDAEDLAKGIEFCLSQKLNIEVSTALDSEVIVNQHISLYKRLLS
jgi:glycosyltransferase involved in cell wall biosynthesis